jgi:ABC-2 type transport system ATP-binding protein
MPDKRPVIEIRNLYKKYKGAEDDALKNIDLTIYEGENFGLLGPNAAGKTTLISIICGLLKYNSGTVSINGFSNITSKKQIRSIIGLVPQEIALYPKLTVKENIEFFGRMHGITRKVLKEKVGYFLNMMHLEQHQSKLISRCSGGIKRRVNLVAGLIHDPQIIFLDEPTLGVDAQSRNLIFEFIEQLKKKGATIIYTTHYIKEAENLCDRVTILDYGSMITSGTPATLIINNEGCSDLGQVFLKLTGKDIRD